MKTLLIAIYRRLPFPLAVAVSRLKPSLAFYIPPGRRDLVIDDYLGQFRMNIDTHADIERRMLSRQYEPETLKVIETLVKPGQVCLDIGANVGAITLALAKAVGAEGRVEAFEPGPPFFERLVKNIGLNPDVTARVGTHQAGMADQPGELFWQPSPNDPGTATIHWADPTRPGVKVAVTTIDDFVRERGLDAVHFLKIDVEGMERQVLNGGIETIRRHRPIIFFETTLCDDEQKQEALEIQTMLTGLGYRLHKIMDHTGKLVPTEYPDLSANTLAIPLSATPA